MPTYRHIESYKLNKQPVAFGNMEIFQKKGVIVAFNVTVDLDKSEIVDAILTSVRLTN